jgi:hypothetical protein
VFTLHGIAGASRTLFPGGDVPPDAACAPPGPFAERAQVVDERAFIPLAAEPGTPVCFTDPSGKWMKVTPARESGGSGAVGDVVRSRRGAVSIRLTQPTSGDHRRWVLYTPAAEAGDEAGDARPASVDPTSAPSNLMLVEFCALDPTCNVADVTGWRNDRVVEALQRAVVPALLLVLGGWGVALWLRRSHWPGGAP